jgi:hypothetical protein
MQNEGLLEFQVGRTWANRLSPLIIVTLFSAFQERFYS